VSGRIRGVLQALAVPTAALVVVVAFLPGRVSVAARLYALFVAGVLIVLALGALRRALPLQVPLATSQRTAPQAQPPAAIGRLDAEIALGVASAYDYHHRLRLRLHAVTSGLLASRRRVVLDREPAEARRILGEDTWNLVRDDQQLPADRLARGPSRAALADAVATLERI